MISIKLAREARRWSQRNFAEKAFLSFKGLQLLEQPGHNARLSSLIKAASALGLPGGGIAGIVERFIGLHPDSAEVASYRILEDGEDSWKFHLFNFVDAFRRSRDSSLISSAPTDMLRDRILCLLASTVESLCNELEYNAPSWCAGIGSLKMPWFVAGVENLKAMALVESPAEFRNRNIFVLGNFLERV